MTAFWDLELDNGKFSTYRGLADYVRIHVPATLHQGIMNQFVHELRAL